jgi:dTDP-4-amino-4,6-dideoxygalactose transaminase
LPPCARGQLWRVAKRLSRQGINLPSSTALTDDDVRRVARTIREALQ